MLPSIFWATSPIEGHRKPGLYSMGIWVQGGSLTSHNHTCSYNLKITVSLQHMNLSMTRRQEYTVERPKSRRLNANSAHTWQREESNPQPLGLEANGLTTKPMYPLVWYMKNVTCLHTINLLVVCTHSSMDQYNPCNIIVLGFAV